MSSTAILVLTGASGAGKTTLIEQLNGRGITGVEGINCDRVQLPKTTRPADRHAEVLRYWIAELAGAGPETELAVLDTQIRPHVAREVLLGSDVSNWQVVLIDCEPAVRNARLVNERQQPTLANPQMDCWAAYLRGQADALALPIIHTSDASPGDSFAQLEVIIGQMLERVRTA